MTLGIQSATLQDLSGGRLLLGLGVANKAIAGWHGSVFDRPLKRAREYIDIVRKSRGRRAGRIRGRNLSNRQALPALVETEPSKLADLSRRSRTADDQARRQNLRRRVHQHGDAGQSQRDRGAGARGRHRSRTRSRARSRSSPSHACRSIPTKIWRAPNCARC